MKVSAKCLSKVLAGGWDHDRLKGKSPGDIGSNPIREKNPSEIGLYAGGSIIHQL